MSRSRGDRRRPAGRGSGNRPKSPPRTDRRRQPSRQGEASPGLGSMTHVGMTRSSNQDAYCAILAPNAPLGAEALLAVADGMGGHQAGEVASAMAVQGLVRHLSSQVPGDTPPTGESDYPNLLAEAVQQVNAEVFHSASRPETRGMGTTMTVALVKGRSLAIAHVGDSRLYLLRKGRLQQLTRDHSWVAEEVQRGALTPEEARTNARRNVLTRAVGVAPQVEVDAWLMEVGEGDTLLLCSDGLHSLVDDEEMVQAVVANPPQSACQALVDRANALGGNDNITVIVAQVGHLGKGTPSSGQRRGMGEGKTVELRAHRGARGEGRRRRRLLVRILLLPLTLPLWVLKVLGRLCWALLRLPFRRW